jgi:hypothetical protein
MTKSTDPRTALDGYLSEYEILKGALGLSVEPLKARLPGWGTVRKRRERKLTLAKALKQASKAGQCVSGAVIEDGKIELKFGEAQTEQKSETDRELAEFEARHET